jgi:hypothetical protein
MSSLRNARLVMLTRAAGLHVLFQDAPLGSCIGGFSEGSDGGLPVRSPFGPSRAARFGWAARGAGG